MIDTALVKQYHMLPRGSRVLCAVSGGADSMCLLHWLCGQEQALGIRVLAAHFEHGLRGEESLRDAAFVEAYCREKGIPFRLGRGDALACAREHKLSLEDAARRLRYAFLEQTASELSCDRIATAHNAEDHAETMLLNLCRGSGGAGLRGIPPVRGRIVRPLLHTGREQIEDYNREHGVPFVEDSSNACQDFSRNRIRHGVSPVLRQINPAFARCAGRTAELLRQDEDCLEGLAREFIRQHYDGEGLDQKALGGLHPAVASRVFRLLCPKPLSMDHVQALLKLLEGNMLAAVCVPGATVRREQGRICFREEDTSRLPDRLLRPGEELELPEAGLRLHSKIAVFDPEIYGLFNNYSLKYESINGVIRCSSRQDGDRYHPQGRGCGKSLKSLFLEAGMTQRQRDLCPVLRDDEGILAVYGFPADERCRPAAGDRVLEIQIEKYE